MANPNVRDCFMFNDLCIEKRFKGNMVAVLMIPLAFLFSGIYKNIQKECRYYLIFIIYSWLQGKAGAQS